MRHETAEKEVKLMAEERLVVFLLSTIIPSSLGPKNCLLPKILNCKLLIPQRPCSDNNSQYCYCNKTRFGDDLLVEVMPQPDGKQL